MHNQIFYISLVLEKGCELVLAPPAVSGVICCKNGVYIVNYKDIMKKRREKFYRNEEKRKKLIETYIDEIVKKL